MKKSKIKQMRRNRLCRSIQIAWSSLDSHLKYAVKAPKKKSIRERCGGEKWNATTIREYAEIILTCASELEQLT